MADGTIGKLNVEITGNAAPLKAALKEGEQATKQSAEAMTQAGEVGSAGFDKAAEGAGRLKESLHAVHKFIRFVFMPAIIAREFVEFIKRFEEARAEADKFRAALDQTLFAYEQLVAARAKKIGTTTDEQSIDAIREQAVKAKDAIQEEALKAEHDARARGVGGLLWEYIAGGMSVEEMQAEADDRIRKIGQLAESDVARERERQRQERAKKNAEEEAKWWIDAMKEIEAYRKKMDDDALEAIEERRKANEKLMLEQQRATEMSRKQAAEFARQISDAFSSAIAQNRAASDALSEKIAYSVNRLREIAESQRQSTSRGSSSTAGGVW